MAMVAALLILVVVAATAAADQHTVGGSAGWTQGVVYSVWANGETFKVGDTLLFNYGVTHSVDEVNQSDYNNCNSGNAIVSYSGGKTTISLNATGPMYFICPTSGHCQGGMKLAITVVAASTPTASPPPPGSPPSTTPTNSTSPPPPPPPPPHSAAPGNFGVKNFLLLEISLLLVALIVFMG
ncbi:Uclacyanin-3 like [Actinidia chinensis var. chinensis]|uniref:Uclacyanin-3 like n=1 Tax=Actinidia chinensis var. chinensis TaxID=1590841 RepID=A0A2R6S0K7_ACTCC|nr:Uclacyanin-3 like [Actinidia chinensis var. chinensis]